MNSKTTVRLPLKENGTFFYFITKDTPSEVIQSLDKKARNSERDFPGFRRFEGLYSLTQYFSGNQPQFQALIVNQKKVMAWLIGTIEKGGKIHIMELETSQSFRKQGMCKLILSSTLFVLLRSPMKYAYLSNAGGVACEKCYKAMEKYGYKVTSSGPKGRLFKFYK